MKAILPYKEVSSLIEKHAKLHSKKSVLEIGAQHGFGVIEFGNATALDKNPIDKSVIRGNARRISDALPGKKFDLIFSNEMLSFEGLRSKSITNAGFARVLNDALMKKMHESAIREANEIHDSIFKALNPGGLTIHYTREDIIANDKKLKMIGYKILERSANHVVLLKPIK